MNEVMTDKQVDSKTTKATLIAVVIIIGALAVALTYFLKDRFPAGFIIILGSLMVVPYFVVETTKKYQEAGVDDLEKLKNKAKEFKSCNDYLENLTKAGRKKIYKFDIDKCDELAKQENTAQLINKKS